MTLSPISAEAYAEEAAIIRATAADAAANPADYPARRPARVLLLACSATKAAAAERLPARELYRGPLWLTLGAADPDATRCQAIALSAEHGFVPPWHAIATYDARLSAEAGAALAAEILSPSPRIACPRGERAARHAAMQRRAASALSAIKDAWRAAGARPLREIALCAGRAYLPAMRAAVALGRELGLIAADAELREINGTIGRMRQDLRAWLEGATAPVVSPATVAPAAAPEAPAETPHLAALRQAEARVAAKLAELAASADAATRDALHDWRRFDTGRFSAPSRLAKCPRDRAILADVTGRYRAAAEAARAGQAATLAAKLARIRREIAAAEARLARASPATVAPNVAPPWPRIGHNGGPILEDAAALPLPCLTLAESRA